MNALVGVRNNQAGQLSPSIAIRKQVETQLRETAAVLSGAASQESVSGATSVDSSPAAAQSGRTFGDQLDKDAFLQLLVLQMQNQDPLEPVDNSEMLAQLAQFSALEGQNNLNENFEVMSGNLDQLNFISASQMLGKVVEGVNSNGELISGKVEGVHLDGSLVVLTVDGQFMSMAGIVRIENDVPEGIPEDIPEDDPDTSEV
jgi:flagellar basal-body rod modification protein FlgD